MVAEICSQFEISQTFTIAYHPTSNGLVERVDRKKKLEVLRPIENDLLDSWEDWLLHIAKSISSSVNVSTGKSPHFILFGVEQRLTYDLLISSTQPVYNIDRYAQQRIHVFSKIHSSVRQELINTNKAGRHSYGPATREKIQTFTKVCESLQISSLYLRK